MKTVIIGGVAGGASAAARLRRLDEKAEIVMLEQGEYISFANCGLPYYVGGDIRDKKALIIQTPESFGRRFDVDARILHRAESVDTANKTVTVRNLQTGKIYVENYDSLIIATGAESVSLPVEGLDGDRVFVVRTVPDAVKLRRFIDESDPKSALVLGGGYSGVEMAENLKRAGLEVAIVEASDHLIAPLDAEMAADVHNYVRSQGVKLYLGKQIVKVAERGKKLLATLGDESVEADFIVSTVGGRPATALARQAGIALAPNGAVLTDERMRASAPDVYAVGDAAQTFSSVNLSPVYIPMAGPANRQGRVAADNIAGLTSAYKGTQGSAVMKIFDMTVATTGLGEISAEKAGYNIDKTYVYAASHASYYPGARNMSLKIIWDKDSGLLLGAQLVGFEGVDKRADVLATAIRLKAKASELKDLELCYAPPYSSAKDPINYAGYIADNISRGLLKQFFFEQLCTLPRDGSAVLLDVRTEKECRQFRIDGFVNIPLDSLRDRVGEIPKNKPVYVVCHSGLRSYIACRILAGEGFDCRSLAGGVRLYSAQNETVKDHPCY